MSGSISMLLILHTGLFVHPGTAANCLKCHSCKVGPHVWLRNLTFNV